MPKEGKEDLKEVKRPYLYDGLLYLISFYHFFLLYLFAIEVSSSDPWWVTLGKALSYGVSCGVIGINVAHELGHRKEKGHQSMALLLLSTSLYTPFFIEHNKGHHRHVATLKDPATSRLGEIVYFFIGRSIWGTHLSAWKLDPQLFIKGQFLHLLFCFFIFGVGGSFALLCFLIASFFGICNLEIVNYIEHYGLLCNMTPRGRPEKVQPHHSWNSNHLLSRLILFELSRHSDHHAYADRPYYQLRNFEEAPQLPTGYSGMIVLSLFPPSFL
jgi:alkane 1-monooxygenase